MRIIIFLSLLLAAILIAGLYGALYDQVTYSISSEFYTKMRFPQFGIEGNVNERWEVAKIGFRNTWSVGLGLGFFLSLTGLLHADNRKMVMATLQSFFIAMFMGLIFAVIAYYFAEPSVEDVALEIDLQDKESFYKVTSMNNYSYVGGTIGMFIGLAYQVFQTRPKKNP